LLLASNREPFRVIKNPQGDVQECVQSMGGLTSALCPVLERCHGVWVSWNPDPVDGDGVGEVHEEDGDGIPFPSVRIGIQESEANGYYNGFCNRALWPLCHTMLRCVTPRLDYWQDYRLINERFADTIASRCDRNDVIWIHDYHLMLVPAAMRRRLEPHRRIGYFHHVPFPNVRVLKAFPWHRQLLKGLLGADSVGFHTPEYANNFIDCCRELLSCDTETEPGTVIHGKYRTVVRVRPIGLDAKSFENLADEPDVQRGVLDVRRRARSERLVLSVDRLDYTKGLLERVEAIRSLYARVPQCRGLVTFMQIAVPTRTQVPEYQQYRAKLEAAVESLNDEFGRDDWQPLIYQTEAVSQRELVSYYLAADIACVTPMADGMNLVASEYCASRKDEGGVLVLSEQAGANALLGEFAVSVDIRKQDSVVNGLVKALTMSSDERARRMKRLRSIVMHNTTSVWLRNCLHDIMEPDAADADEFFGRSDRVPKHRPAAADGESRARVPAGARARTGVSSFPRGGRKAGRPLPVRHDPLSRTYSSIKD
jgi:trehalose 6-phosphate synthase/phosphatase